MRRTVVQPCAEMLETPLLLLDLTLQTYCRPDTLLRDLVGLRQYAVVEAVFAELVRPTDAPLPPLVEL